MPGAIDLHCHSTASDGVLSPEDVVGAALARGVRVLALTDHDTLAGVGAARAAAAGRLDLVTGVELSCSPAGHPALEGTVHVVGLLLDEEDAALAAELERQSADRARRVEEMVRRLEDLGYPVTLEQVRRHAGSGNPGRPHVARALVEAGVVTTVAEAFTSELIGDGGRAYVPRRAVSPERAVDLIHGAGGVAVLAHPGVIDLPAGEVEDLVEALARRGLDGLEVDHPDHAPETRAWAAEVARRRGLVPVGASDFHGGDPPSLGTETTTPEAWERLRGSAGR